MNKLLLYGGIILSVFVCTGIFLNFKEDKDIIWIKNNYFEKMPNKNIGELVEIISYGKAQWHKISSGATGDFFLAEAVWINESNEEIRLVFKFQREFGPIWLTDVYFNNISQGLLKAAFFLDLFNSLDQGKKLADLVKHGG